jgi:DNA-binding transcriptional ArsR family regulator
LVETLKALADPTRLRILRYLASQPMTPSQLARRLRLRAPTVVHHLKELRLAGLVQVTFQAEGEKHYALRHNAVNEMQPILEDFLSGDLPLNDGRPDSRGGKVD